MAQDLYVAVLTAYDATLPGTRTLYYATGQGFTSTPSDTPANTFFNPVMQQPVNIARSIFAGSATAGQAEFNLGELILLNPSGTLDALKDYGVDGRAITIYRRPDTTPSAAFPAGFTVDFVGTMEQCEVTFDKVTIRVRGRQLELDTPLQTTKYAGTNTLPTGLEGVSTDLKGTPKPVLYGSVLNITPPCVNTSKLIYQVNDGAISSISNVYDRGVALNVGFPTAQWATVTSQFGASTIYAGASDGAGTLLMVGAGGKVSRSTDNGATWTAVTSGVVTDLLGVSFGAGLWVLVGNSNVILTSATGATGTFTARTSPYTGGNITAAPFANGVFMSANDQGYISTSTDGITWAAKVAVSFPTSTYSLPTFGNGRWLVGAGVATLYYSKDNGATWALATMDANSSIVGTAFGGGRFVAMENGNGVDATNVGSTLDGRIYTSRTLQASTTQMYGLAYVGSMFMAGGSSGLAISSPDGEVWTKRLVGFSATRIRGFFFTGSRGIAFGDSGTCSVSPLQTTYASLADLSDDTLAPAPGCVGVYAAGGYFRLGAKPDGAVTCDAIQGAAAANRTAAQIFGSILTRAGKVAGTDYSTTDITTLDTANSAVLGFYAGEEISVADALTQVVGSVGAWWAPSKAGIFRTKRLVAPSGTSVVSFVASDILGTLERIPARDQGRGIPVYRCLLNYAKNFTVQTTDLAGGVADDRRAVLAARWLVASYTDASVQTAHLLAPQTQEDTLLTTAADALTEATRRQVMRGTARDMVRFTVQLTATTAALDLGDVVTITHSRYALTSGKQFIVIGLEPDAAARTLSLTCWG